MKTKTQQTSQKKKTLLTCIYAAIVGLLILACAIIIATATSTHGKTNQEVGPNDVVDVSTSSYVLPMQGATVVKDYSGTKLQYNDSLKQWEIHKAVDFVVGEDSQVAAIANGTVSEIYTNHLEGTVVKISHSNGLVSVYKSLDKKVNVKVGDVVTAGAIIGNASNSMTEELNTGAHLHLETWLNGVRVDPNNYLSLGDK